MNANELHGHQSCQGAVLGGWLKRFPLQFHFIHGLFTTRFGYDIGLVTTRNRLKQLQSSHHRHTFVDSSQRKFFSLESTERGIASMDECKCNCTVTKAVKERFLGVGLNGSLCNFISFMACLRRGLATTLAWLRQEID